MTDQDAVIYQSHATNDGHIIIQATLNSEKSLHALNQAMIDSLLPKLECWQQDDNVVAVMLDSVGDKAFCAGGDVVELYHAMAKDPGVKQPFVQEYFSKEYTLDYKIHTFTKPIMLWGNGFVMGGGLGLMAGASHRIVTEYSKVAMPEITIGLYPDVGATYFLNKMPDKLGLFLGLTAAQMNAADCLEVNLADYYLLHQQKQPLLSALIDASWENGSESYHETVDLIVEELSTPHTCATGNIQRHRETLVEVLSHRTLSAVIDAIGAIDTQDKWLLKAQRALAHGSALSARILERQLAVGQGLSLAQCFKLELAISVHCGEIGEVTEGIRALLIDKDNQPKWRYAKVDDVEQSLVDKIFSPIWTPEQHPLIF